MSIASNYNIGGYRGWYVRGEQASATYYLKKNKVDLFDPLN